MISNLLITAWFYAVHVLALAVLVASSWVLGRSLSGILGRLGGRGEGATARRDEAAVPEIVATCLGLAALGHLVFFLGLAGQLRRMPLILLLAGVHLVGWRAWRSPRCERRALLALAGAIAFALPLFLLSLYPPTAFDATLYHLPFARAFAASGGLPFLPHLRVPVFPALAETLFAALLLTVGESAVNLVSLAATLLTAALLYVWGREAFSRRAGGVAAAAFLGGPIVVHMATSAYAEALLTLFAAAGCHAFWRFRRSGGRGWLALAAVFLASACDVKYLGLPLLAGMGLALAGSRRRLADLSLFAGLALLLLLPAYGRIVHFTGNPVFPFLPGLFGPSPWAVDTRLVVVRTLPQALEGALSRLVRLPWDVVFARGRVGHQPPYSPFFLLALPLLALAAWRDRRVLLALVPVLAYAALMPLLPADSRYLMPVLPLLCIALGGAVDGVAAERRRLSRPAWGVLLGILVAPGWLYAGYRLAREGEPPPATAAARETYLAAHLPLYPAIAWVNATRGSGCHLYGLFAEEMGYFAAGTYLGDWSGPERFGDLFPVARDPEALWRRLRGYGADTLLVPRHRGRFEIRDTAPWTRRFQLLYADAEARVYSLDPPAQATPKDVAPIGPPGVSSRP